MIVLATALIALPSSGVGAPFPGAKLEIAPEQRSCNIRYQLSTGAKIGQVAAFYMAEASQAGVPMLDDTGAKFTDYRTLLFTSGTQFIFVVLGENAGRTTVRVVYRTNGATNATD